MKKNQKKCKYQCNHVCNCAQQRNKNLYVLQNNPLEREKSRTMKEFFSCLLPTVKFLRSIEDDDNNNNREKDSRCSLDD